MAKSLWDLRLEKIRKFIEDEKHTQEEAMSEFNITRGVVLEATNPEARKYYTSCRVWKCSGILAFALVIAITIGALFLVSTWKNNLPFRETNVKVGVITKVDYFTGYDYTRIVFHFDDNSQLSLRANRGEAYDTQRTIGLGNKYVVIYRAAWYGDELFGVWQARDL